MKNDNIVPLLGVSMAFGKFPAMVTSWMMNGLLTEYLKSGEDFDKMHLVIGLGRGIEYLHSQNVVHSDIRAVCCS
ncbi:hypothetical protein GALMADRAFT_1138953 [Galerina marginata CBS 339.88]|uniref:Protein kinase domain-containing protein n=1 Tax=Galerina marginata (strain CBS 339.88) TaxID=685588 RepID=A0A067S7D1_GALM3|nr:hypothetical protein GALMADRAFT_1138953 [Galerina marginata CBS 339.88]